MCNAIRWKRQIKLKFSCSKHGLTCLLVLTYPPDKLSGFCTVTQINFMTEIVKLSVKSGDNVQCIFPYTTAKQYL